MAIERLLPTPEAHDLLDLTAELADRELAPRAAQDEADGHFPREQMRLLGRAGLLGLPYGEELGGGGQPYEVYLQVLELLAARSATVAVGVSVHVMSAYPIATFGTAAQQQRWLPDMLAGDLLGAYCLSEAGSGSDAAAMTTRAEPDGTGGYRLRGSKAWTTHGGHADYYTLFARTAPDRTGGISCFHVDGDAPGLSFDAPERKMGLTGSPTATVDLDDVVLEADRVIDAPGRGLQIALSALDSGRLGIGAVAVGLAQGALDAAVAYARQRQQFGRRIIDHQGLGFMLADMAAGVESARATVLHAARLRDHGRPFRRQASIAKLVATDMAMKVTTDAVQVFGGYGYSREFAVERYFREAKVMQIFEGTNQIQRVVIARDLADA